MMREIEGAARDQALIGPCHICFTPRWSHYTVARLRPSRDSTGL